MLTGPISGGKVSSTDLNESHPVSTMASPDMTNTVVPTPSASNQGDLKKMLGP
jgi:hypothetical protein